MTDQPNSLGSVPNNEGHEMLNVHQLPHEPSNGVASGKKYPTITAISPLFKLDNSTFILTATGPAEALKKFASNDCATPVEIQRLSNAESGPAFLENFSTTIKKKCNIILKPYYESEKPVTTFKVTVPPPQTNPDHIKSEPSLKPEPTPKSVESSPIPKPPPIPHNIQDRFTSQQKNTSHRGACTTAPKPATKLNNVKGGSPSKQPTTLDHVKNANTPNSPSTPNHVENNQPSKQQNTPGDVKGSPLSKQLTHHDHVKHANTSNSSTRPNHVETPTPLKQQTTPADAKDASSKQPTTHDNVKNANTHNPPVTPNYVKNTISLKQQTTPGDLKRRPSSKEPTTHDQLKNTNTPNSPTTPNDVKSTTPPKPLTSSPDVKGNPSKQSTTSDHLKTSNTANPTTTTPQSPPTARNYVKSADPSSKQTTTTNNVKGSNTLKPPTTPTYVKGSPNSKRQITSHDNEDTAPTKLPTTANCAEGTKDDVYIPRGPVVTKNQMTKTSPEHQELSPENNDHPTGTRSKTKVISQRHEVISDADHMPSYKAYSSGTGRQRRQKKRNSKRKNRESRQVARQENARPTGPRQQATAKKYPQPHVTAMPVPEPETNRHFVSLSTVPTTQVEMSQHFKYKQVTFIITGSLQKDGLGAAFKEWARTRYHVNTKGDISEIFAVLDQWGVINAGDLGPVRQFLDSVRRPDLVHVIDLYLLGESPLLYFMSANDELICNVPGINEEL